MCLSILPIWLSSSFTIPSMLLPAFSAPSVTCKLCPRLSQAIDTFARYLRPGGIVIVEPWFSPGVLETGKIHAVFVDEPELKIARMNVNRVEGKFSYLDFQYLVGTPEGVEDFHEMHALGLFTGEQYLQAFQSAGLQVFHDDAGLDGRGLYIGIKGAR